MRRREFIPGLGSTAAWPLAAWAQQPALRLAGMAYHHMPSCLGEDILGAFALARGELLDPSLQLCVFRPELLVFADSFFQNSIHRDH